ncbi:MAG: thioredoxin [Candidatus Eisenbacteria bacterium]|uniref:Thioredoxin n=1 Tax=Eiseniibacteriota bacterium TaxID=2212470 RepID=A0A948W5Z9_UNCEI|nr:thioredoxin [Candidatus Eisenbacteria bacterium]MBU1950435.1 thioredoxin [Candidatus Eisenbacteria bacterium]MBU2690101.1 thioredoxin [Candidatus Eisenbacteria bacterium]
MNKVTDDNFNSEALQAGALVMLDFGATWCGPCKALEPILAEISEEYGDRIFIGKADIEEAPKIAERFSIMSVPTVIFLKAGEEVGRFVGAERKDKIVKKIEGYL